MQYTGLDKDDRGSTILPFETVSLTNCFASTYAVIEDFETWFYNMKTFVSETGTIKLFDTVLMDPGHILMDMTVEWEMCEFAGILGQFKSAFGGDPAAIAD